MAGFEQRGYCKNDDERIVERPDAENAAQVEGLYMERSAIFFLADEELGDEVSAENEEEVDTVGGGIGDSGDEL
jgi:hypothetical protein